MNQMHCGYRAPQGAVQVPCDGPPAFNLWFASTGGLYATACNAHRQRAEIDYAEGPDRLIQVGLRNRRGQKGTTDRTYTELEVLAIMESMRDLHGRHPNVQYTVDRDELTGRIIGWKLLLPRETGDPYWRNGGPSPLAHPPPPPPAKPLTPDWRMPADHGINTGNTEVKWGLYLFAFVLAWFVLVGVLTVILD